MSNLKELADFFRTNGWLKKYDKGQNILSPDDPVTHVMMIKSGAIKVFDIDEKGNERTVSLYGADFIFPLAWLLKANPKTMFFYDALDNTEAYSLPLKEAINFISSKPKLLMDLLDLLTKAYINHDSRVFNLQKANVSERLDFVLYYLAKRLGNTDKKTNVAVVPFTITHQEIANMVGISRESVSRDVTSLENTKVRSLQNKTYIYLDNLKIDRTHKIYNPKFD